MNLEQKRAKIPFDITLDKLEENSNVDFDIQIVNQDFIVQDSGDINCNIDMDILSNYNQNRSLNIIDKVDVSENTKDQDYSVVVYIVKKGDTLWKIAKRFKTTVDFIVRTNGIEDENKIYIGQKLYIPKYSKIGI